MRLWDFIVAYEEFDIFNEGNFVGLQITVDARGFVDAEEYLNSAPEELSDEITFDNSWEEWARQHRAPRQTDSHLHRRLADAYAPTGR